MTTYFTNLQFSLIIIDFSLNTWLSDNGYPITTALTGTALQDFMEDLQTSRYMDRECNITTRSFVPQNANGWNTGKTSVQF